MVRPIVWDIKKNKSAIKIILDRIADGESVRTILGDDREKKKLPSRRVFLKWLIDIKGLSTQYAHACEVRADAIFDDIIEIADDSSKDKIKTINGVIMDSEFVARSRIRIDARKWIASKLNPKKYGDIIDITSEIVSIPAVVFKVI